MDFSLLIYFLLFHHVLGERGGITHCSSQTVPTTNPHSLTASSGGQTGGFLMQDGDFMFGCCGVIKTLKTKGSAGTLTLQVWRQTGADEFTLISQTDLAITGSGSLTSNLDYGTRVSFQEGDILGWTSSSDLVQRATDTNVLLNRRDGALGTLTVGDTHTWNSQDVITGFRYAIQAVTAVSTPPYFKNLPATLVYADTDLSISGITLLTLEVGDVDPEDAGGLTIEMDEAYVDRFQLVSSDVVTSVKFTPGTYYARFRVEEDHCGQTSTATLTVTVTDSDPSITNLPASANVHEDTLDETLLYTVTTSDPMNQAIWCDGDWDIGTTAGSQKPFVVKMLSTAEGDSRAGIYLIEWPLLDYDVKAQYYQLSITCTDPAGNTDTGNFYVNIIKNQLPIFSNLGNMVEIDATTALVGDVIFTVSATDADNDQITYTYSCSPATNADGNCPFAVYDSGEVVLTSNVYLWNTFTYTLTIQASDLRDTTTARTLIVYIINYNNDPVLTNVAGVTESVPENSALGLSLFQASATDADSGDSVTFWMVINPDEGWGLFEMNSAGLLTTHSTKNINYEVLIASQTFTITVYAHDGKEYVTDDLTITVTDVNEFVTFRQPGYSTTRAEGVTGNVFPSAYIDVVDPDGSETHTYTMNCGTYDAYFSLDSTTAIASFAQDYDLDAGILPAEVCCSIYVEDSAGHNDTAELCLIIEYTEDNAPVFNPSSYAVTVRSDAALGNSIIQVTVTDADESVHGEISYTLNQASLGGTYLMIDTDGTIYANQILTPLATAGIRTVVVTATDGTTSITANVVITFEDATVIPAVITDRNRKFIEDTRNVAWITILSIAMATCFFVVILIIVRYCMARKEPFFKNCFRPPKPRRKRELDPKRRPKPFPRQTAPEYKHVHANEILRHTPLIVATPEPVEDYSVRPTSGASRVTVSQVDYQEDEDRDPNEWMNVDTDARSLPPSRVVTRVRNGDREYINGGRRNSRQISQTPMSFGDIPELKTLDDITNQNGTLRVTPSPISFDNSNRGYSNQGFQNDDDFRSERLSIAAEDPTPLPRPAGSNLDQW